MDAAKFKARHQWVRDELKRSVDFWLKNGIDKEHGGVYTCLDREGNIFSTAMCATKGNMYASIKEIIRRRESLDLGGVRAPLYDLTDEDMPQIEKCVAMIDAAMAKWVK